MLSEIIKMQNNTINIESDTEGNFTIFTLSCSSSNGSYCNGRIL